MNKNELIEELKKEYSRWLILLQGFAEDELTRYLPGESLSTKDKVAHLFAWQQLSIARLEAAIQGHDPIIPPWLISSQPDTDDVDQDNEQIFQMYLSNSWQEIFTLWRTGFEHFISLCSLLQEEDLFKTGKYPWLPEYALADVLTGSLEHHREHFDLLQS